MARRLLAVAALLLGACAGTPPPAAVTTPIVIAHRGASGERAEHTLEAYRLAIAQGADFIEPDLVMTRDGVLIARHENELSDTTDVADRPEFAARRRTQTIDGRAVTGWFSEDFTLAEIKTLRARERLPQLRPKNTAFDGQESVPTLEEILALVRAEEARTGRVIGVYPETKHPSHFAALGLAMERPLVATLARHGFDGPEDAAFIQSFETANLRALNGLTGVRLVQLIADQGAPWDFVAAGDPRRYADLVSDAGLAEIAGYADGIGVHKSLLIPRDADGRSLAPTDLAIRAQARGLAVHVWTFRSENVFLPAELRAGDPADPRFPAMTGDAEAELRAFYALEIDGVFADFPAAAIAARD